MVIIGDYSQREFINFEDLEIGDVFKYHNSIYLKTSYSFSVTTNAFNLSNPETSIFCEKDPVRRVKATILIEPF